MMDEYDALYGCMCAEKYKNMSYLYFNYNEKLHCIIKSINYFVIKIYV